MTCGVQEPEKAEARRSSSNRRGAESRLRLKEDTTIDGQETSKAAQPQKWPCVAFERVSKRLHLSRLLWQQQSAITDSKYNYQFPLFNGSGKEWLVKISDGRLYTSRFRDFCEAIERGHKGLAFDLMGQLKLQHIDMRRVVSTAIRFLSSVDGEVFHHVV
jgi:hypothetical protein